MDDLNWYTGEQPGIFTHFFGPKHPRSQIEPLLSRTLVEKLRPPRPCASDLIPIYIK
jgi:hypothetical protein